MNALFIVLIACNLILISAPSMADGIPKICKKVEDPINLGSYIKAFGPASKITGKINYNNPNHNFAGSGEPKLSIWEWSNGISVSVSNVFKYIVRTPCVQNADDIMNKAVERRDQLALNSYAISVSYFLNNNLKDIIKAENVALERYYSDLCSKSINSNECKSGTFTIKNGMHGTMFKEGDYAEVKDYKLVYKTSQYGDDGIKVHVSTYDLDKYRLKGKALVKYSLDEYNYVTIEYNLDSPDKTIFKDVKSTIFDVTTLQLNQLFQKYELLRVSGDRDTSFGTFDTIARNIIDGYDPVNSTKERKLQSIDEAFSFVFQSKKINR